MKYCAALAALMVLSAPALHAENYTHEATGLKLTLPKGWKATEKNGQMIIQNAEKTVHLVGLALKKEEAKAVFENIEMFLENVDGIGDAKVTDGPKKEKVNGLQQAWYEGTCTLKGPDGKKKKVEWDLTIVTGGKAVLFLVGMGELDENEKAYEKLFESIRKADDDDK